MVDVESARSTARGAVQLAGHVLALVTLALIASRVEQWWLRWPAIIAYGVTLVMVFCPLHECVHRTAFASRRVNDVVAAVAGAVLILPSRWFRLYHGAHHRYAQDPERDPELANEREHGQPTLTRGRVVLHAVGASYWVAAVRALLRLTANRADDSFVPAAQRRAVVREARLLTALYALVALASIAARSSLIIRLWLLPIVVGQPFLRGFLLAEHTGCALDADPLVGTRTTETNAIVRALTWNMPFHAEHHAQPRVPFHALGRLHDVLADQLAVVGHGYVRTYVALQRRRWRVAVDRRAAALSQVPPQAPLR